ncbi:MAG: hypothetical protein QOG53_1166 [Frankiales bacterium]|nr:hypothetical protein [Frankiales bacterium]
MRRRALVLIASVALGTIVSGCAGVPTNGAVHAGNPVPAAAGDEPLAIRQIARGPSHGQTPDDIVRGFLTASASIEDNHSIAREYLTAAASGSWDPSARVVVYDDNGTTFVGTPRATSRARVVPVRAPLLATIGPDGGYTVATSVARLNADIRLVQEQGEWRISNPPPGVILTRLGLTRSFEQLKVYFLDRTLDTVVPDDVFLEASSTALATALVRRLLRGPTTWLEPAVRTAIPPGTTLIGTAPIDDRGTVTVDLSQEVLASTSLQRAQLSAQIGWTLRQLPVVTRVHVLAEGSPIPGVPAFQGRDTWSSYDPSALSADATGYFRAGNRLRSVSGTPVAARVEVDGTTLDRVALSPSGTYAAGLLHAAGRTTLYVGSVETAPRAVLSNSAGFTPPSWDAGNELWTVELGAAPRLLVVRPPAKPVVVAAPELAGRVISAARISRDGTRLAVIAGVGAQRELLVGRVRTTGNDALRVEEFRRPGPELTAAKDLSWADPSTLAVLAVRRTGALRPWLVRVDGAELNPITTAGVLSYDEIAAAPGQPTLVESRGLVYSAQRGLWTVLGRGSQPAYPG